ncbi:MAG: hypothetical protein IPQ09_13785 [Myxococcales bacterium]|nr:hypothetical protein [Myxococcales bacterium]
MAAKRKTRTREAQLAFEALSIEGGLLSPEWLSKVAQLQAGTQAEADYRIHKGLNLRDEIGRYWRIAQAHWADFKAGREAKADPKAVSERFVLALLRDAFRFTALVPGARRPSRAHVPDRPRRARRARARSSSRRRRRARRARTGRSATAAAAAAPSASRRST